MKISIENFKSIPKVHKFEIKPITILSGTNSSGKSSFVQMLMLIKKTLRDSSTTSALSIDPSSFKNLIHKQDLKRGLLFKIYLNSSEIDVPSLFFGNRDVELEFKYESIEDKIYVSFFSLNITKTETDNEKFLNLKRLKGGSYIVNQSHPSLFIKNLPDFKIDGTVTFSAMFPQDIASKEGLDTYSFQLDWSKIGLTKVFDSFYYIGPIREKPRAAYQSGKVGKYVGEEGQFTAQILKEFDGERVSYYTLNSTEEKREGLLEAVNYWLCEGLGIADRIYSEKVDDIYRIILEDDGLKVNIQNVGYGVSQVLPIIVQGLIMPDDGILVIEQPEIHLHPKVQSLLFDFLFSLTLKGRKIIVETHSSHFIMRMRRRIAEDESNEMDDRINLTFIEDRLFRNVRLDDYGTILHYYPEDFIEHPAKEMEAILRAQIKKRNIKKHGQK